MNWAALVKNTFPPDKDQQWNATRLVLASMHIQYYTLNESDAGDAISPAEWDVIVNRNLLNRDEIEVLKTYSGFKPFLPLIWAMAEVESALLQDLSTGKAADMSARFSVSDLLSNFRELAFVFRGHCGQITNWLAQPVPFPYFHVLTVLLILDMLLIGYSFVTLNFHAALTSVIYTVVCMVFMGLKEVAIAMSNPFGDDDIDFDLEKMLAGAFKNSVAILKDQREVAGSNLGGLTNPVTSKDARFTVDGDGFDYPSRADKKSMHASHPSTGEPKSSKISFRKSKPPVTEAYTAAEMTDSV